MRAEIPKGLRRRATHQNVAQWRGCHLLLSISNDATSKEQGETCYIRTTITSQTKGSEGGRMSSTNLAIVFGVPCPCRAYAAVRVTFASGVVCLESVSRCCSCSSSSCAPSPHWCPVHVSSFVLLFFVFLLFIVAHFSLFAYPSAAMRLRQPSVSHYGLVQAPIPNAEVMRIPPAKAAPDKEWGK